MNFNTSQVPAWLRNAHDHDHINNVLQVLADRERSRVRARVSSCHRPDFSLKHRLAHVPPLHTKNPLSDHYSIAIGCSPENRQCNRYNDIEPYDRTRVITGGRYFNGNWVRERAGGRWAIATQAPLPNTAHEFLSIVAGTDPGLRPPGEPNITFNRVRTVVQLTQTYEDGRQKAHAYFPSVQGDSWVVQPSPGTNLPPLKVTLIKSESVDSAHGVVSTLAVSPLVNGATKFTVILHHLLYHAWPDHGIPEPEDRAGLLNFIRLVYRTNADTSGLSEQNPDPEPPIMVNCSAGVGRTGAFIALSSLLRSHNLLGLQSNTALPTPSSPYAPSPPHTPSSYFLPRSPLSSPLTSPLASPTQTPSSYFSPWLSTQTLSSPPVPHAHHPAPPAPLTPSPLGPLPDNIIWDEVAQEIDSLREQRPSMVQRPEQTVLVYEVLIAAFSAKSSTGSKSH